MPHTHDNNDQESAHPKAETLDREAEPEAEIDAPHTSSAQSPLGSNGERTRDAHTLLHITPTATVSPTRKRPETDSDEESDGAASAPDDSSAEQSSSRTLAPDIPSTELQGAPVQAQSTTLVTVDRPQELHKDWSSWASYLREYETRTSQLIRVQEVLSCANRNKRLARSKAAQRGDRVPYVPVDWEAFQRTYICTHGWQPRRGRSEGKRVRKHTLGTDCMFRFVVQMVNEDAQWQLRVKHGRFIHNHAVDEAAVRTHPSSRGVKNPANAAQVEAMVGAGAKRARIYEFLLAQGENVLKRDVDNLVGLHRSKLAKKEAKVLKLS